jgi:hypothetical protein
MLGSCGKDGFEGKTGRKRLETRGSNLVALWKSFQRHFQAAAVRKRVCFARVESRLACNERAKLKLLFFVSPITAVAVSRTRKELTRG